MFFNRNVGKERRIKMKTPQEFRIEVYEKTGRRPKPRKRYREERGGMAMGTGEEYYRRYLSGDESGFDLVIDLYREPLIFFLLRYLPNMEDAEDAAEDAFVSLLLHPYREGGKASLKTYLFTLGRNRALSLLKEQKRLERRQQIELVVKEDADYPALEERMCQNETRRALLQALTTLPPDYREALYLLYFEDLSLEETAKVMKKNKKQVENLSYRGKQALKEKLGKEIML